MLRKTISIFLIALMAIAGMVGCTNGTPTSTASSSQETKDFTPTSTTIKVEITPKSCT